MHASRKAKLRQLAEALEAHNIRPDDWPAKVARAELIADVVDAEIRAAGHLLDLERSGQFRISADEAEGIRRRVAEYPLKTAQRLDELQALADELGGDWPARVPPLRERLAALVASIS